MVVVVVIVADRLWSSNPLDCDAIWCGFCAIPSLMMLLLPPPLFIH